MFDLQFNRAQEVALARFHGHVTPRDLAEFDVTVMLLHAVEAPGDFIYDFSEVEKFDISIRSLADWAQRPQPCPERRKFFVTSRAELKALARLFAAYQDILGCEMPMIVDQVGEALSLLNCPSSGFRPVERNWLRASISMEESAFVH
jgi:hypothetical protein